jgi:hypothetical protein
MEERKMGAEPGQGYERLVELIIGAKIAAALHVVVDRGLADALARGPQTAEALAPDVQIPSEMLQRFLRVLTQVGLFAEVTDGVFANTGLLASPQRCAVLVAEHGHGARR